MSNFQDIEKYRDNIFENLITRFRPVIDKLIDEGAPRNKLKLLCEHFNMKPTSLQNRLSAVLRYLATYEVEGGLSKYKRADYERLKSQSMFKLGSDSVSILPRKGRLISEEIIKEGIEVETTSIESKEVKTFRDKVLAWLESDEKFLNLEGRKDLGGRTISQDDMEWIRKTFASVDIEYKIAPEFLRAVKGEE